MEKKRHCLRIILSITVYISEKNVEIDNIYGQEFEYKYGHKCPLGVKGRNSDNRLYRKHIGWEPSQPLIEGMKKTYEWIKTQVGENE